jgi:hypothetical protein
MVMKRPFVLQALLAGPAMFSGATLVAAQASP